MVEAVSVIITCYNLERYIDQCVTSVKEQDYEGSIQIIVVNDASYDSSRYILDKIDYIHIVQHTSNGGVLNAMLSGLKVSQHDVIFFLDGDDVWHRTKVSFCMREFREGARFVTHDLNYINDSGQYLKNTTRVSEVLGNAKRADLSEMIRRGILKHDDFIWLGSAFGIRRSCCSIDEFLQQCIDFEDVSACYQDWPLAVWVALQDRGVMSYVNEKLFDYRIHANNYSGSTQTVEKLQRNLRKSLMTMMLIETILEHFSAAQEFRRAFRNARRSYSLQLSAASGPRSAVASELFRAGLLNCLANREIKPLIRAVLSIFLGHRLAHEVLERFKTSV